MSRQTNTQISVIIPTYNRKKQAKDCLNSVASNTLSQDMYEVICVDDFSSDGTQEMLLEYNKIKNFTVLLRDNNSGTAAVPKNDGLERAKGDYVFFIDSDDSISEHTLSDALETAVQNQADMVCVPYWTDSHRKIAASAYSKSLNHANFLETDLIKSLMSVGKLNKREMLEKWKITFPEHVRVREDNLFTIKCFAAATNISVIGGDRKYYFIGGYQQDNLSKEKANPEHIAFMISDAVQFIFSLPGSDLKSKIALCTYFINRMHPFVGDHTGAIDYLHYHVGHYFEIFKGNPYSQADHFIYGVHKNSPRFIGSALQKLKGLSHTDIVGVENGKIYMEVPLEEDAGHAKVNVAHLNTVSTFLSELAFNDLFINLYFYVHNSLLANYEPAISLVAVERKNQKNQKKFFCQDILDNKNKYHAKLDLVELSLLFSGIIDFIIQVELNGYTSKTRLKADPASPYGKPILNDFDRKKYILTAGPKQTEFAPFITKLNRLSMRLDPVS